MNIDQLTSLLTDNGIKFSEWGVMGQSKPVEKLLEEINIGETTLEQHGGVLVRKLQAIFVHVTYGNKTLREDKAVWKSRARKPRVRVFEGSVAGKVVRGEDLQSAAAREIGEELQLKVDPSRIVFNRQSLRTTNSYSFPGLVAVFDEAFLSLELRADEYKENGYVEETDDKITYFVWVST